MICGVASWLVENDDVLQIHEVEVLGRVVVELPPGIS
jgi:hypothetical protein